MTTHAGRKPIRVLLVNDHRIVLWGLERLLETAGPRIETVGKATSNGEAARLAAAKKPDVALVDVAFGALEGLDLISGLAERSRTRVLAFARGADRALLDAVMLAGASGVIGNDDEPQDLVKAIVKVHEGEIWLDRVSTSRLLGLVRLGERRSEDPERKKIALLTARETEVVAAIAGHAGATIKKIAGSLDISDRTLRNHLTSIYEKLGLSNRLDLFVFANKHRLTRHPASAHK
ncbi:MAG: response regulator [Rhodospirillaceae bacterium]